MAIESTGEFDLGPLSWVQAEIDQALTRGVDALMAFRAKPDDASAIKHARSHVHQAAGAIQMVGLDAVVAFTDELERQLARLEELPPADAPAACDLIERACRKLRIFLDEIVNGAPPLPLKLYPEYEALQSARGVKATPTDLFYPDLSPRAPRIAPRELIAPAKLPSYLVKQRRLYQRGLLAWLRDATENEGAQQMRDAVAGIEDVTNQSSLRAFWWTTGAMLEALAEKGLDSGFGVKQLAARIDLQIRRVAEGSSKVSDRLRREVLYFVAISAPVGPQVQAVQRTFKVAGLIPSAEVLSADVVRLQPILRDARDQLAGAKDAWLKVASGRAENLGKLKQTMASVHARAAEVHDGALLKLTAALVERLGKMPASGVSEPVAMEFATALLLAEGAFENFANLTPDFPKQVDAMIARFDAARAGRAATNVPAPMLDEMGRRAAERVLMAQVGREIQANLRHMEQVLDAFFRDNGKRAELATLTKDSQQIRGALRMLGLDDADRLLAMCQQQVETYANPDTPVSNDDLELLAESLSGLGFYIEAVEQQRPDRERLIAPLIARRAGEVPVVALPEEPESVEDAVEEMRTALPQLIEDVQRAPADTIAREDLRQKLTGLRDDAELIGDRDLAAQTSSMLKELAAGDTITLAASVEAIAEAATPTPEISEETARLLATDATGLDGELLEIFLAEAAEVLEDVAQNHRILQGNPGDREALSTVRRGFHTLKGSGRMVGLTQLGDLAYEVEKIQNRLIDEERPVTTAVVTMIGVAQTNFKSWVDQLTSVGRVSADPAALYAALAAVERELPGALRGKEARAAATSIPSNVIELPVAHAAPAASLTSVPTPVSTSAPTFVPASVPTSVPTIPTPILTSPPTLELVELPELGADDDEGAQMAFESLDAEDIELIDIVGTEEAAVPPILRLVETGPPAADSTHEDVVQVTQLHDEPLPEALPFESMVASAYLAHEGALSALHPDLALPTQGRADVEGPIVDAGLVLVPDWMVGAEETPDPDLTPGAPEVLEPMLQAADQLDPMVDVAEVGYLMPDTVDLLDSMGEAPEILDPMAETPDVLDSMDEPAEVLDPMAETPDVTDPIGMATEDFDPMPEALDALASIGEAGEVHDPILVASDVPDPIAEVAEGSVPMVGAFAASDPVVDFTEVAELAAQMADLDPPTHDLAEITDPQVTDPLAFDPEIALPIADEAELSEVAPPAADEAFALYYLPEIQTPAVADVSALAAIEESDNIRIGDVTVSLSLWKILCDEADLHLITLEHELQILQFDPLAVPSAEMVRAGHTLCGIHRTGGFPLVADTAKAVEQVLIALEQRGAPLPGSALPILAHAVSALTHFCGRVKARSEFTPADREETRIVLAEIDDLRAQASADASDAETEAAELARREDEHTPALALVPTAAPEPTEEAPPAAEDTGQTPTPVLTAVVQTPSEQAAVQQTDVRLPAPTRDPLASIRDDVDMQVLPIFLDEAAELFPQAGEDLRAWRRDPHLGGPPANLRRTLHTFKGSSRMAGAMRLGELAHLMESRLSEGDAHVPASASLFDALESDLDQIAFVLDQLRAGKTDVPLPGFAASADAAQASAPAHEMPSIVAIEAATTEPLNVVSMPTVTPSTTPLAPAATVAPAPQRAEATPELETGSRAQLRVRADTIDRLVNEAGEVAIARARVEGELRALKANLLELTGSVIRLRGQMREIEIQAESQIQSQMSIRQELASEFDPLEFDRYTRFQELTRSLAEGINDVSTVQQSLLKNLDDADAALAAQARLSRDVQQRLFAIRTVPFGSLSERLYRIMRTTAKELDKRANLEIQGAQVELDRSVLEKLVGPLEHLLRNALDHGLESREARLAAGKSDTGEITLNVRQVGNEVVIDLADDGSGVDYGRVRERARSLGLLAADATPTNAQLVECLFQPGFSTASKVTQISGRGIGMDVVRSEIAALGGRVEVTTDAGQGTRFTLTLPLTLAVAQAVLIRAGGRLWALPAPMVEQVQQVKPEVLLDLYVKRNLTWQGRDYPFYYLPRLLGDTTHFPETVRYNSVLLLRSGQTRVAIHVDEMIGNQEVVVKNIGPQLARVSGISGATVLGTGEIVLIINPVQLAARVDVPVFDPTADEHVVGERPQRSVAAVSTLPLVMIVDDSLTVRKITSRLLTREGFAVLTAKDGLDALQVLVGQTPDVILLDIEMPRMDGFEFAKTIKGDPKTAGIPIVMITSRTAEKHRNRAAELGVDLYLGKPYQEEELLRNLREMLALPTPA